MRKHSKFWINALLVGLGIGGIGLSFYPDDWLGLPQVFREVGHASLIASILGFTVDPITKKRLVDETARDLVEYLIGYKLPREMQEHIREIVISSIVRQNFEMRCELTPFHDKRMNIKVEISYTLRNFSTKDQQYTPYFGLEKSLSPTFESISAHHLNGAGYCYTAGDNLVEKSKWSGHTFIQGDPIIIKAAPVAESEPAYKVTIKYGMLLPDDFVYVETLLAPTMNVSVKVNKPSGYEVRIGSGKDTPMQSGGYWEYKQLFVAGEYIGIRWFPADQGSKPIISLSDQT